MKIAIHASPIRAGNDLTGWSVKFARADGSEAAPPRELKHCGRQGRGFPVPAEAAGSWVGKPHEPLCAPPGGDPAPIRNAYEAVVVGDAKGGEIEQFGRYLSAVLLGDNWPALESAAGDECIELELHFSPDDAEMNRLPWEMLYGPDAPLAAHRGRDVSITRVVGAARAVPLLSLPLRVLFVIGGPLDDKLRPGAEYIGLLRRMKIPLGGVTGKRSVELDTRPLLEATRLDLRQAVADFRPDVVHFICHGVAAADGGRILLTNPPDPGAPGGGEQFEECNAAQLFEDVGGGQAGAWVPRIVVLNACHTADPAAAGEDRPQAGQSINSAYLSLAAQLVDLGIPVAIGMAGEIADAACRVFTYSFYEALLKDEPVARATARARRAAMFYYDEYYTQTVEWVRPTIFSAPGALDQLCAAPAHRQEMLDLSTITERFLEDKNLLCDRLPYLKAFDRFRREIESDGARKVLAFRLSEKVENQDRFGKTRLLEEIAAVSVTNNYIPCLLRSTGAFDPPADLYPLALKLADVMNKTRERFGLAERPLSNALKHIFSELGIDPGDAADTITFKAARKRAVGRIDELATPATGPLRKEHASLVKEIILADFRQLVDDVNAMPAAQAASPPATPRRPLLLLDDIHLYEGVTSLLFEEMIGEYGLGDATLPVPLVFTYSAFINPEPKALQDTEKFVSSSKYVEKVDLRRFAPPHEARLAYSQYLLSREQPLTASWFSDKRGDVEAFFEVIHIEVQGVPKRLYENKPLELLITFATLSNLLLPASDEQMMKELVEIDEAAK